MLSFKMQNESKILELITIVVFTHERHEKLIKVLSYFRNYKIKIIVVDSSLQPLEIEYVDANCTYLHFPNMEPNEKIRLGLENVTSKYTQLSPDDDYLSVPCMVDSILQLESNDTYAVCQGLHGIYEKKINGAVRLNQMHLYAVHLYAKDLNIDICEDTPLGRINSVFSPYMNVIYGVTRTEPIVTYFNHFADSLKKYEYFRSSGELWEVLYTVHILMNGGVKTLNRFGMLREAATAECATRTMLPLADIWGQQAVVDVIADFFICFNQYYGIENENLEIELYHIIDRFIKFSENGWKGNGLRFKGKITEIISCEEDQKELDKIVAIIES